MGRGGGRGECQFRPRGAEPACPAGAFARHARCHGDGACGFCAVNRLCLARPRPRLVPRTPLAPTSTSTPTTSTAAHLAVHAHTCLYCTPVPYRTRTPQARLMVVLQEQNAARLAEIRGDLVKVGGEGLGSYMKYRGGGGGFVARGGGLEGGLSRWGWGWGCVCWGGQGSGCTCRGVGIGIGFWCVVPGGVGWGGVGGGRVGRGGQGAACVGFARCGEKGRRFAAVRPGSLCMLSCLV